MINTAENTGRNHVTHAHIVRLESVVVCRITDRLILAGEFFQSFYVRIVRRPKRLFHEHVFAAGKQVFKNFDFRLVGRAYQGGVVLLGGHFLHRLILRLGVDRIHRGDEVGSRHGAALVPLHSQTDDDDLQPGPRSL